MSAAPTEEALYAAVARACELVGLSGDDVFLVASLVERSSATWPGCCGSGCEPCMNDVIDAARRARLELGIELER